MLGKLGGTEPGRGVEFFGDGVGVGGWMGSGPFDSEIPHPQVLSGKECIWYPGAGGLGSHMETPPPPPPAE